MPQSFNYTDITSTQLTLTYSLKLYSPSEINQPILSTSYSTHKAA